MHEWDGQTPLEETLAALEHLVQSGKVRYVGCSNFAGWQVMKALGRRATGPGCPRFVSQQVYLSLQERSAEYEIVPSAIDQGLGLLIWSPLAGGLLSGKYRRGQPPPEGSRHASEWDEPPVYDEDKLYDTIEVLVEIAEAHDVSPAQVALAWLLARPGVTTRDHRRPHRRAAGRQPRRRRARAAPTRSIGAARGGQPAAAALSVLAPAQDRRRPPRRRRPVADRPPAMTRLGRTELDVFPLCLGGNVFGWTADEPESYAVLDAYVGAGGNFIDTANSYLVEHGRSETIIGRWLADRGNRDQIVLATKVGGGRDDALRNLRPETIESEARASLERLQTDRIDLYYAHFDDEQTPLEETLRAFDGSVKAGTVRHVAASNYSPERLRAALEIQREHGLAEFTVLQPHYNLVEREFERTLLPVAESWDLAVLPYFGLAKGFLTGKYRPGGEAIDSPRADACPQVSRQRRRGQVLDALDEVAAAHDVTLAAVALAWLRAQPRVVAPIASARSTEQLEQILPAASLELSPDEVERLSAAASMV